MDKLFKNGSIAQAYDGKYKIKVKADFGEALKILSFLKEMEADNGKIKSREGGKS